MLISFLFIILSFSFNLSRAAGGTTVVFLDHDDPAVHLSGDWTTDDDQASIGGSFAATTDVGATANVALPPGTTGLNYFGFRNAQGGLYATCVDCAGDNSQLQIFDANDPDTVGDAIPVVMISVSDLDPTVSHTLSVVNLPDLRFDNAGRLTLNALLVDIDDSAGQSPVISSILSFLPPCTRFLCHRLRMQTLVHLRHPLLHFTSATLPSLHLHRSLPSLPLRHYHRHYLLLSVMSRFHPFLLPSL
ncbi:hypothetical protein BV25DRAFT_891742 [Artomyces pyxidatus]|uniref:Uncharacterized protein n=1 Tax=Artomyces pyxidatus TaxID=48021 RepID=A0ACB8THL1_9AGAM|nr:hypothetical protein BV25DRAFT_891742 [Artomyces pyxidatus]